MGPVVVVDWVAVVVVTAVVVVGFAVVLVVVATSTHKITPTFFA